MFEQIFNSSIKIFSKISIQRQGSKFSEKSFEHFSNFHYFMQQSYYRVDATKNVKKEYKSFCYFLFSPFHQYFNNPYCKFNFFFSWIRCQFYQHFTRSFYVQRSPKEQKIQSSQQSFFCSFGDLLEMMVK